jgi:hypothetical protein
LFFLVFFCLTIPLWAGLAKLEDYVFHEEDQFPLPYWEEVKDAYELLYEEVVYKWNEVKKWLASKRGTNPVDSNS